MPVNDGGPAFPLRDYFAAHAPPIPSFIMEDFLAYHRPDWCDLPKWNDGILEEVAAQEARWCWHYANAMLAQREREVPHAK